MIYLNDEIQYDNMDTWIMNKLNKTIIDINNNFDSYNFSEICQNFYDFFQKDFCDV
jgi:valyl-tRNA synthetase